MFEPTIPADWQAVIQAKDLQRVAAFLDQQRQQHKPVYPPSDLVFTALRLTPLDTVKVVILGQDPYHGPGQAHGLSFSVPPGEALPPSLRNIFKELSSDLGLPMPKTGDLTPWARQGVLLLNAVLTVEAGQPGSHAGVGWEGLTDALIRYLSEQRRGLVFVLWGAYAQRKAALIDQTKHLVLKSVHPSPLSAHRGFFGSRPFSQINRYLEEQGQKPIDWRLPAGASQAT